MADDGSRIESRPGDEARLLAFEPFVFDRRREMLFRDGEPVPLPPKPAQVLACLLDRAGEVVGKAEILDEVWPDTHVIEHSLTEAIHVIRRELGDDAQEPTYVQTVPRRGYRFVADVRPAPTVAPPEEPEMPARAGPLTARQRLDSRWLGAGVVVAMLLVVAVLGVVATSSSPGPGDAARKARASSELIAHYPFVSTRPTPGVSNSLSPDGDHLAFVPANREIRRLVVRDLRTGRDFVPHANQPASLAAGSASQMGSPIWSPDGARVGYVWEILDDDGIVSQMRAVPVSGGTPEILYEARDERIILYDWSPDGARILFARRPQSRRRRPGGDSELLELSLAPGSPRVVDVVEEYDEHGWSYAADYAPGGERLAYDTSFGDSWGVVVVSRVDGRRHRISPPSVRDQAPRWSPDGRYLFLRRRAGDSKSFVLQAVDGLEATGEPVTVLPDIGNRWHHNWSAADRILYHQRVRGGTIHRLPVDPRSVQPTGPPETLSASLRGRVRDSFWPTSIAGRFVAMVSTDADWRPHLLSRESEERLHLPPGYRATRVFGGAPDGRLVLLSETSEGGERFIRFDPSSGRVERLVEPPGGEYRFTGSSLSPGGERLAVERLAGGDDGGQTRLELLDLDTGDTVGLPLEGSSFWTAWSPDGQRLAVSRIAGERASLHVVFLPGGPAVELAETDSGFLGPPAWSPDQRWIVFAANPTDARSQLRAVPAVTATGDDVRILREADPARRLGRAHWSSDGTAIYYGTGTTWVQLWVIQDTLAGSLVAGR